MLSKSKEPKDHLVRAKLRKIENGVVGMFKCGGKRCKVCDSIVVGNILYSRKQFKTQVSNINFRSIMVKTWLYFN